MHAEIHMYTRVCVLQLRQLFKLLLAEAVAFIVVVPTNSYSKGRFKAGFVASVASPLHKPALLYIFFLLCSSSQRRARARARATSNEWTNEQTNEKKKEAFFRLLLFLKDTRMWVTYEVSRNQATLPLLPLWHTASRWAASHMLELEPGRRERSEESTHTGQAGRQANAHGRQTETIEVAYAAFAAAAYVCCPPSHTRPFPSSA